MTYHPVAPRKTRCYHQALVDLLDFERINNSIRIVLESAIIRIGHHHTKFGGGLHRQIERSDVAGRLGSFGFTNIILLNSIAAAQIYTTLPKRKGRRTNFSSSKCYRPIGSFG